MPDEQGLLLKPDTAKKLDALIQAGGGNTLSAPSGGFNRQTCFVKPTGWNNTLGCYNGVVSQQTYTGAFSDFTDNVYIYHATGAKDGLLFNFHYLAQRTGDNVDGTPQYMCQTCEVDFVQITSASPTVGYFYSANYAQPNIGTGTWSYSFACYFLPTYGSGKPGMSVMYPAKLCGYYTDGKAVFAGHVPLQSPWYEPVGFGCGVINAGKMVLFVNRHDGDQITPNLEMVIPTTCIPMTTGIVCNGVGGIDMTTENVMVFQCGDCGSGESPSEAPSLSMGDDVELTGDWLR